MGPPEISVVVASHDRALRLRWLLNALEEQSLDRGRWEVVVAHDSAGEETQRLLEEHPLTAAGVLSHRRLEPTAENSASRLRNVGWGAARGAIIAFTDDDCRPPSDWVQRALDAAYRNPGAIVQGTTLGDPDERAEFSGPHPHTQAVYPPTPWAEACNILYPRALLERVGGFIEDPALAAGEDTDLALRVRKQTGAAYVGAPEVLTYHAVQAASLPRRLSYMWRWGDLAWLVKHHPEARDSFYLNVFWKARHVWLAPAIAGLALSRRNPLWIAAVAPWAMHAAPWRGHDPRGRLRALSELPGEMAFDSVEFAALVRGSIKHRSLFL